MPERARLGRRAAAAACAAALLTPSCSIGNLSHAEIVRELDSVVLVEGTGPDRRLAYRDEADVSPWYMRFTLFYPLRPVLGWLLGTDPTRTPIPNPSGHARALVAVLGGKAGDDLRTSAEAVQRLVPIVELDNSALNRITALGGIAEIARAQGLQLLGDLTDPEAWPAVPTREAEWIATLRDSRPRVRPPEQPTLEAAARERYAEAMAGLSRRPLSSPNQRLALVHELAEALGAERDSQLLAPTEAALRAALGHCLRWTVIEALQGRELGLVDVRLQALHILHCDGGPDSVATILALMAAPPEALRTHESRFDPQPVVRRRLVHLCGQLDAARGSRSVQLPGRAAWEPVAPLDYLGETVLRSPDDDFTGLRTVAQEALCRSLGRPVDYDREWVQRWYRARQGLP